MGKSSIYILIIDFSIYLLFGTTYYTPGLHLGTHTEEKLRQSTEY